MSDTKPRVLALLIEPTGMRWRFVDGEHGVEMQRRTRQGRWRWIMGVCSEPSNLVPTPSAAQTAAAGRATDRLMTLIVYTARVTYAGPDRLDVARSSAGPEGLPFAPSWGILRPVLRLRSTSEGLAAWAWRKYVAQYTEEMRTSYCEQRPVWDALLARDEVTLLCYCTDPKHCHRTVLAQILGKLGATVRGERAL